MTPLHTKIIGNGPPLVLLHGWGWHSAIWQPLIPILEKKYQLFLIDLPGFGKSSLLSNDYEIEEIAIALLNVTPAKSAWLGWSLGGLITTFIAATFPERVTHLLTVASSPTFVRKENWPGIEANVLEKFSELLIEDSQQTLRDFLTLQLRGSPKKEELFAELQHSFFTDNTLSWPALLGGLKLLIEVDLRKNLENIHCPSLYIFGSLDTIVPITVMQVLSHLAPHAQYKVIKRAGHMPFLSNQNEFIDLLNQFFQ